MIIDSSLTYKELVKELKTFKIQYEGVLASFSNIKKKNEYIRISRDNIYALKFTESQKDLIWTYLNGYLSPLDTLLLLGFFDNSTE